MFICCGNKSFEKKDYHCCGETAEIRSESPLRCCQEKSGDLDSVKRFDPNKGEKCCRKGSEGTSQFS